MRHLRFAEDTECVFGRFTVMDHHRQVQLLRQGQLETKEFLLLGLEGCVPVVVESDLTDRHQLIAVLADGSFDDGPLLLPVLLDFLRVKA